MQLKSHRLIRYIVWLIGCAAVVLIALGLSFILKAAPGGTGLTAKWLCSLVYVSGFEPERAKSLYVDTAVSPFGPVIAADYDFDQRSVTATGLGLWKASAEMRNDLGCTLTTHLDSNFDLSPPVLPTVPHKDLPQATFENFSAVINTNAVGQALDHAFSPDHNTLAVVVLYRGELIAERYAEGINSSTPLPGASLAKSLTVTLIGMLVEQGKLQLYQPGIVAEWRNNTDGGQDVTLDHLLRMTSGLDLREDQTGADPNTRMLFIEPDTAFYAAGRGLSTDPGTKWEYTSGNYVLVSKAIVDATGGSLESSQRFIRENLLTPLGADSFILEPDAAGIFVGSTFILASAHDWAKLGQLYLNDGTWEGERFLPEGWVDYVTKHTPESGSNSYGAGFWTIKNSNIQGPPEDTFYASGHLGQSIIVVPSRSLVVVRLGASDGPTGTTQLVEELVAAMR